MKTGLLGMLLLVLMSSGSAQAEGRAQVMLVLDASGSMWKRVENKEKILIARQVVGDILERWDENTDLGVIAYGHRRKGDCNDIETVVPVGPVDADAIGRTVNGIRPKGKTPLGGAVRNAAKELRFTEERATVILISDGKETCGVDPCALGAELEEAGVDFTAHVIGFDIADDERAQLQCLAEATGGRYFSAEKADELKMALTEAVQEAQLQPDRVVAVLAEGKPPLAGVAIDWEVTPASGAVLASRGAVLELPAGAATYSVDARLGEAHGSAKIQVEEGKTRQHVVILDAGRLILKANVSGPEGTIGNPDVTWSITNLAQEAETASVSGAEAAFYLDSETYGVSARFEGMEQDRIVRLEPGAHQELTFDFELTLARLDAPDTAPAGADILVTWEGPDSKGDYISVAAPDEPDRRYVNYAYTRRGTPANLLMPDKPGVYELRYVSGQSQTALVRRPINVTEVSAILTGPESVAAGSMLSVDWEGPDNKGDYISVAAPDEPDRRYVNYAYTRRGAPANLLMPDKPGVYELRYVSGQSQTALARLPINVTEVSAVLAGPESVAAGSMLSVDWEGPDNKGDYISVAAPDEPDRRYVNYAYTRRGTPANLQMPDKPGVYELRYVSGQSQTALVRRPINVTEVTASLNTLDVVPVTGPIQIEWQGPDNKRDYIAVAAPSMPGNKYLKYVYTRKGNPARLPMPAEPGIYELRYVMGQSQAVLARRPIQVVPEPALPQGDAAGSGEVTLQAVDGVSGEPIQGSLSWMVYSLQGGAQDIHRPADSQPLLVLPPGRYRAVLSAGSVSKTLDFNLNAGESVIRSISVESPQ